MRWALSWLFYGLGDGICTVFDRWLPWGMVGPIYRAYNGCMTISGDLQGRGPGPWTYAPPPESGVEG